SNWAAISTALTGCVLVRVAENAGFAKANNIGAGALPGTAYLLVNNDAVPRPGAVEALVAALERPEVGIVVPRLLNADLSLQRSVVPFTTPLPALVRASGLSRFLPDRRQPDLSTHWSHDRSREVQAATGAVMLVRCGSAGGGRALGAVVDTVDHDNDEPNHRRTHLHLLDLGTDKLLLGKR